MSAPIAIRPVGAGELAARLGEFAALLSEVVEAGASINFVVPFGPADAEPYWRETVLPGLAAGRRVLLSAERGGRIEGSVQLDTATPPNQPHRAEITKLMTRPEARRQGIARALMARAEAEARARGRSLVTLDTRTGDAAEPLYLSLGYVAVGQIPGYSLDPLGSGRLDATTLLYKTLG